jgi:uncharacterized protein
MIIRRLPCFLWAFVCFCLGLGPLFAANKNSTPVDEAPQLISTTGGRPSWQNTKELKAAAAKGDPQACFELGTRMLEGDNEVRADLTQARLLMEKAAAGGMADASFRLGKIYHDARGVSRDYAKALDYYTVAARRGVPEAQHNIGAMLVSARGVKRNYVEGLAWLLVAEKSGAASDAVVRVRDRLARRPQDIAAAEARAQELLADLPHATVVTGRSLIPVVGPPKIAEPAAPVIAQPLVQPTMPAPMVNPIGPLQMPGPISPPPALPPTPPTLKSPP